LPRHLRLHLGSGSPLSWSVHHSRREHGGASDVISHAGCLCW
jgi:hypothetical protein